MLRSVAFKCCDRLAGAYKYWANNVGLCCVVMLLSFGPGFKFEAPAKRSQHANTTCRNIIGRNMLRAFGHRVATCWVLMVKFEPTTPNMSQHIATRWPNARNKHVAPNIVAICCVGMLRSFGRGLSQQHLTCCNTWQHGGQTHTTCCAQQCCDMLRSFGRGLKE